MPQYHITDPQSGRAVTLTGDSPPTEAELTEIFAKLGPAAAKPADKVERSALSRGVSGAWSQLNPIAMAEGIGQAVAHPINTGKALISAQVDQGRQAWDLAKQGRYTEAAGHAGAAALPILGPAAANVGQRIADTGDIARGVGEGVGMIGGILAPGALARARGVSVPAVARPTNPAAVEALAFAESHGIPVDAALASGNKGVAALQHVVDRSLGGSVVAGKAQAAQAQRLGAVGEQLAERGHRGSVTVEQAGQGVKDVVLENVRQHAGDATTAYDKLRAIEADPVHRKTVQTGTRVDTTHTPTGAVDAAGRPISQASTTRVPVMEEIQLPVDLRAVKASLKPIHDELMARYPVAQQEASKGLKALQNIVNGPDYSPLSTVDANLGAIKSIARSDLPELRSVSQGTAAGAVKHLDAIVRKTAADAGPEALQALESGRTATIAKYGAADVLDSLQAEPVRVQRGLTAPADSAVAHLRAVAKEAPAELPKIGRAVLDGLLEKAASGESGFDHAQRIAGDWQKLGPQTKLLLYKDPAYIHELDKFFRLAKMAAQNPNPSGTAQAVSAAAQGAAIWANPIAGVSAQFGLAGLSKILHSKTGVALLTKGFRIPMGNKAGRAAWVAELGALTSPSESRTPALESAQ